MSAAVFEKLRASADGLKSTHLRELLKDEARCSSMYVEAENFVLDYSREKVTPQVMEQLQELAKVMDVEGKKQGMFSGKKINETEGRAVLHCALRAPKSAAISVDGKNVVPEVHDVLNRMQAFSDSIRSGKHVGHTGKTLTDVVCIGIGGSYLGVEFVFEALKTWPQAEEAAKGRNLRFLANVDPIDVRRALDGLNAETTLVVVISKTFTTAETMLNARTVKDWVVKELGEAAVSKHVVACSTALEKTKAFGIDDANVFGFWDWVGGRFSVWSAVGVLPLALQYGFGIVRSFLDGAYSMDQHFLNAPPTQNLPTLMGLLTVWNSTILGYEGYAVLPYCQALTRFVAHIQQLDMESNGKRVQMDGTVCPTTTGAIYFGEPGTNGQHSFYQLLHQGRAVPADFIGFRESQNPISLDGEPVSNHDELMSNFFAQPDALALGKTDEECRKEGIPEKLIQHKVFEGDRPSLSLLLPTCSPTVLGQLLAAYEHRTAVQGWVWGINSFDQWGVELGKVLGVKCRKYLTEARNGGGDASGFLQPTQKLLASALTGASVGASAPAYAPSAGNPAALWQKLKVQAEIMKTKHLRDLLKDGARCDGMMVEAEDFVLDYSRQRVTPEIMTLLQDLAASMGVESKKKSMFAGEKINETEGRAVLHAALRASANEVINVDGKNVVPEVHDVLSRMKAFSEKVRSGQHLGHTGKPLTDVVAIGIGGSYLGVEFVFEALKTHPAAADAAKGKRLRFLANVDPIDVKRALSGLNAETTLVIVISKTFTTAETMLNARTVKQWIVKELGEAAVSKHVVACSTALEKTKAFGIDDANVFGFWDWVGGRFSVWSAVGVLPLSLQYGFDTVREFLDGANSMDQHFATAPPMQNLPMLFGLLSVWNSTCLGHETYAVLPYCQALMRFVAHIQQLDMESNGKRVQMDGTVSPTPTGSIYFGEPGTNGQHSFYQLMHQGRTVPADFIGFRNSQNPVSLPGEPVSNHDELMSNFFAQPDALALGKTEEECRAEGIPEKLVPHKVFSGNRPSLSLLLPECTPCNLGKLLALYEHRTAVQGWVWGINSFDQWGVELGKVLGVKCRKYLSEARKGGGDASVFPGPTQKLLASMLTGGPAFSGTKQTITSIHAREIFDSRGNPTVEVDLCTETALYRAAVPSGASTGVYEALELRDGDKGRLLGKGVLKAVDNVNKIIAPKLIGMDVRDQAGVDKLMVEVLDGSKNEWGWSKSKLGANAILAVSMACCRAGASACEMPLYQYIAKLSGKPLNNFVMPVPSFNVINGGSHAGNRLACQEFMILPTGASSFRNAMEIGAEVYHTLKGVIKKKYGQDACNVGDEGGFAPGVQDNNEALDVLMEALEKSGHASKVKIGTDVAASEFWVPEIKKYDLDFKNPNSGDDMKKTAQEMIEYYKAWFAKYPFVSIEDPFDQDDWEAYSKFQADVGQSMQIVGDDLLVTNPTRVRKALDVKACNALLLKVNQIGSVTEAIEAATISMDAGWGVMVSHRSGETEDSFIADLVVGLRTGQIKTGAPCRSERLAKYNQLLRIEEELGEYCTYAGTNFRKP